MRRRLDPVVRQIVANVLLTLAMLVELSVQRPLGVVVRTRPSGDSSGAIGREIDVVV